MQYCYMIENPSTDGSQTTKTLEYLTGGNIDCWVKDN